MYKLKKKTGVWVSLGILGNLNKTGLCSAGTHESDESHETFHLMIAMIVKKSVHSRLRDRHSKITPNSRIS